MTHPLKVWRLSLNLSQPLAGERLGVDAMTVSRWERGEHLPRKAQWPKIEEVTGITPSQMIGHVKAEAAQ
ncbi:helix-turn-helix domain-containing protein [Afipia clevelandensis]|uniref:helix-turn-helix domain-containing protein n=1 Tax=Afipia clevelandensis TaxID=1034 RepID=UPI00058AF88B